MDTRLRSSLGRVLGLLGLVTIASLNLVCSDRTDQILAQQGFKRGHLRGARLVRADLREAVLCNENLSGCDLSSANLSGANFTRSNLERSNLTRADLSVFVEPGSEPRELLSTCFKNADLARANLTGLKLIGVDFGGANLSYAKLDGATVQCYMRKHNAGISGLATELAGANLRFAKIRRATLCAHITNAIFDRADLTDSVISGNIEGTSFKKACLDGADLQYAACIEKADFRGATYDDRTRWPYGFEPKNYGAKKTVCRPKP